MRFKKFNCNLEYMVDLLEAKVWTQQQGGSGLPSWSSKGWSPQATKAFSTPLPRCVHTLQLLNFTISLDFLLSHPFVIKHSEEESQNIGGRNTHRWYKNDKMTICPSHWSTWTKALDQHGQPCKHKVVAVLLWPQGAGGMSKANVGWWFLLDVRL